MFVWKKNKMNWRDILFLIVLVNLVQIGFAYRRGDAIWAESDILIVGSGFQNSLKFMCNATETPRIYKKSNNINGSKVVKLRDAAFQIKGMYRYISEKEIDF